MDVDKIYVFPPSSGKSIAIEKDGGTAKGQVPLACPYGIRYLGGEIT
jgi:hypothetical protein